MHLWTRPTGLLGYSADGRAMHLDDALAGRCRTPSRQTPLEMVPAGRHCVPPGQKPVHLHVAPLARERCSPFTGRHPCTATRAGDRSPPRPEREEARCTCMGRLRPWIAWLGCHSCGARSNAMQRDDRPQWRRRRGWMAGPGAGHDGEREGGRRRVLQPAQAEVHAPERAACRPGWPGLAAVRAGRAAMPCNVRTVRAAHRRAGGVWRGGRGAAGGGYGGRCGEFWTQTHEQ